MIQPEALKKNEPLLWTNERVSVASYLEGVRFLAQLLRNVAG